MSLNFCLTCTGVTPSFCFPIILYIASILALSSGGFTPPVSDFPLYSSSVKRLRNSKADALLYDGMLRTFDYSCPKVKPPTVLVTTSSAVCWLNIFSCFTDSHLTIYSCFTDSGGLGLWGSGSATWGHNQCWCLVVVHSEHCTAAAEIAPTATGCCSEGSHVCWGSGSATWGHNQCWCLVVVHSEHCTAAAEIAPTATGCCSP